MSKYIEVDEGDFFTEAESKVKGAWYRCENNRFYVIVPGLVINWDNHYERFYYFISTSDGKKIKWDLKGKDYTKEEFRIELAKRKTKLWRSLNE